MKYIIAVLAAAMLLLSSGAMAFVGAGGFPVGCGNGGVVTPPVVVPGTEGCINCTGPFFGNNITQTNDKYAEVSDGMAIQKTANWAVLVGDLNNANQLNKQTAYVGDTAVTNQSSTNLALAIGGGNYIFQANDPIASLTQMNEVIVLGFYNLANQSNYAEADAGNASVYQDQNNFGLIFGNNSTLVQNNTASAYNYGLPNASINQIEANVAYLYGFNNLIDQTNIDNATVLENCTGSINQTDKNLAFAITACCSPMFIPECNNTTMNQTCPDVPPAPAAAVFPIDYPLDP